MGGSISLLVPPFGSIAAGLHAFIRAKRLWDGIRLERWPRDRIDDESGQSSRPNINIPLSDTGELTNGNQRTFSTITPPCPYRREDTFDELLDS